MLSVLPIWTQFLDTLRAETKDPLHSRRMGIKFSVHN